VFERRGYHGATTQDIADELGIRQATLYYYFSSKEAALEQICLLGVKEYVERAEAIAARGGPAAGRLQALIANHLEPLAHQPAYVRVFLSERRHLPDDARHKVGRLARRYEQVFERVVDEGIRRREFRAAAQPRVAALALLGMCNTVTAWYGKERRPALAGVVHELSAFALKGLSA